MRPDYPLLFMNSIDDSNSRVALLSSDPFGDDIQHGFSPVDQPVLLIDFPLPAQRDFFACVIVRQIILHKFQRLFRRLACPPAV